MNSPPVNIPSSTPSASPTRTPPKVKNDDLEMNGFSSQVEHNIPSQIPTMFYQLTSFSATPPCHHTQAQPEYIPAVPSFQIGNEINSPTVEPVNLLNAREAIYYVKHVAGGLGSQRDGVFLTWEDLWVTVSAGKDGSRPILQGITGYAQPGEVLAIMGPSGCGKSTLLDALAGRLDSNTRQSGHILVNGHKQRLAYGTSGVLEEDILVEKEGVLRVMKEENENLILKVLIFIYLCHQAYVTQDDTLITTLTVREAVYYSALLQLPDSMSRSEKRERADTAIKEMGLQDAMNTRIGGWENKGLSGGQKRRVSICIEILTRPKLLFLDEPTSGLDSAASYHIMKRIVGLAKQDGRTVVASIHQPSSEVFELFHNLCLLSYGKTVYFGPASAAEEFFSLNGFPCPTMRNPSDHYLRTINKDFDPDIEQGYGKSITTEEAIYSLVNSYKSSKIGQQLGEQIAEIHKKGGGVLEKGSQASFITQSMVLTRRSFVNMYRDIGYYWLRLAIYIALCFCVGTIFYDMGYSYGSIQARGSMLMFVAAFLTFMSIGGFPSFVEDMKIFRRERLNGHYGVAAFAFGNTFSSIPFLLLISLAPGAIANFLGGLQRGIDHFVYFALVLFACTMLVESLMMIVASIVPNFLMGIITGAGIQGVMILSGGFFRLPNDLPNPFWKYPMYYIAFHKYANQGLLKNEFEGQTFLNNQIGGVPTISGEEILRNVLQMQMGYSKWVDLFVLLGMVVLYRLMFFSIIKSTEKVKPMIRGLRSNLNKQGNIIMANPSSTP
ncbi:hypothetical protein IFM89_003744 [Coptis chinensis]|uniref:ABC transporter domain-containing protein n=1 Tax=Coptis chinensis TaxID=261450 RepID=A0A835LUH1_9MAGN|nr:hypothetical protein IFM89_003744 [Coptis chinensis]